ncbi:cubilin [Sitodiplosis mosellana]|uniref:cubilin n=1 Tax=Sitodiplosis mosellana TaxID=263140 RepID=UPI002444A8CB|nr:cubilin [Sitodiplosis mosellana]
MNLRCVSLHKKHFLMSSMSVSDCIPKTEEVKNTQRFTVKRYPEKMGYMFKRTFDFILLLLVMVTAFDYVLSQSDSYTIGIHQIKSANFPRKWSRNELSSDFCGGIFRNKQVVIKSPRYPNKYPKNENCEYVFYSPFVCTNEFHIQFLDFQIESSLSCSKDKVLIGTDEVLCGQVIGIMKYKAINGTLRIKFISDETIENKGFELLVTRLPCSLNNSIDDGSFSESSTHSVINIPSSKPHLLPVTQIFPVQRQNNNVVPITSTLENVVANAEVESVPETTIVKPICSSQTQQHAAWPSSSFYPSPLALPVVSPLPSCCTNVYNQQKFYLISPGFPNVPFPNDCLFFIERIHPNICRLRIDFKYFLLGDWQQRQCTHSFVEIDGRRFCGCKSGTIYFTQWGPSPKPIRFANTLRFGGIQGFILEITQEACPYRSVAIQTLPVKSQLVHMNDPRRCSLNYISWLNHNTNQELLARSICIRNHG